MKELNCEVIADQSTSVSVNVIPQSRFLSHEYDESDEMSMDSHSMQIVPYCCFLSYARNYDQSWQIMIDKLREMCFVKRQIQPGIANIWPDEVIMVMISYMDAKSLASASRINKQWNLLCSNNEIWEELCFYSFGITSIGCNHKGHSRDLYKVALNTYMSVARGRPCVYNRPIYFF